MDLHFVKSSEASLALCRISNASRQELELNLTFYFICSSLRKLAFCEFLFVFNQMRFDDF